MVSVSLVELRWVGAQSHKVCSLRSERRKGVVKVVFPDRFVAALAQSSYGIQVKKNGKGWDYRADLGREHVGYDPQRSGGELPTDANHPSVYDWDGDQLPGATLHLSIPLFPDAKLYVVQRGHSILNGKVLAPGRVEGKIDVRLYEQIVIGAKPKFLTRTPQVMPDSDQSYFVLTQVAAGTSCTSLAPAQGPEVAEEEKNFDPD